MCSIDRLARYDIPPKFELIIRFGGKKPPEGGDLRGLLLPKTIDVPAA